MAATATATQLTFELRYRKEAKTGAIGKAKRDEDRYASLPDRPAQFSPVVGDYRTVSTAAYQLNESQIRSGFLDYLFFPEVETAPHGVDDLAELPA